MAHVADRQTLHPVAVLLLGFPLSLFLGALLSDVAYYRSYEIQWVNFAAWLNAGGLIFGAIVLVWAAIHFFRRRTYGRPGLFLILVAAMWVVGFFNALVHGKDGWASMPMGLILSVVVAILALAAAWAGLSQPRRVEEN